MKRILTSMLAIALLTGAAQAQTTTEGGQQKHHHSREHRMMAFDKLNLSTDQKARLKSVREDFRKQLTDLKKQDQITVAEMRSRKKELRKQFKAQVATILTKEQKDQLAQLRKEWKHNGRTAHFNREGKTAFNRHHRTERFKKLQQELNLTKDQQEKVAQIRSNYKEKAQSLRKDEALSQDQRKEQLQELRKQQRQDMKTVLSSEQLQKLKSLKQEHTERNAR